MIYIFEGCKKIFQIPGMLCSGCGDLCKQFPGACSFVADGCKNVGSNFKHYFERPLSMYFVLSVVLSLYTFSGAQADAARLSENGCKSSNFLLVLQVFAIVNIVFAGYLCWKVWRTIMERQDEFLDGDKPTEVYQGKFAGAAGAAFAKAQGQEQPPPPPEPVAPKPGFVIVPGEVVKESFKKVWMEDFLVLAMFFALLALVYFCTPSGMEMLDGAPEAATAATQEAPAETAGRRLDDGACSVSNATATSGEYFFGLAFSWSFLYMCCSCFNNKVAIAKPTADEQAVE